MAFDLDKVIAEAEGGEPFEFTFGGDLYTMPAQADVRAIAALTTGRLDAALGMLLGDVQWERMQTVEAILDQESLLKLFEAYAEHTGMSLGESSASSGSSNGAAKRSRPTSKGSTKSR